MQRKILIIISTLLVIISVSLFLYPTISKATLQKECDIKIEEFDETLKHVQEGSYKNNYDNGKVDDEGYPVDESGDRTTEFAVIFKEDLDRLYKDSLNYNRKLLTSQNFKDGFEGAALDLTQYGIFNGVYGYVSASSIGLHIPIYLGANDYNMRYGATHLLNTSLPIGGKNSNTVLAGHTNYIGRTLFDNIPALSQGDIVTITNYFGTVNYQVTEEKNIDSTDLEESYIQKNEDLLILLTCSNGGATRYIVICERIY